MAYLEAQQTHCPIVYRHASMQELQSDLGSNEQISLIRLPYPVPFLLSYARVDRPAQRDQCTLRLEDADLC